MSGTPPKPRFALTVGIVGHRPDRLPDHARVKVASVVARVLERLGEEATAAHKEYMEFFSPAAPLLSLVSPLAEGADRIAAHAALAQGWILDVVLPFSPSTYKAEFQLAASSSEFDAFLPKARSVLVLPGDSSNKTRAYEALGLTLLSQSDIILAIWDRGPSAGAGGTTDTLEAAARLDVPVIHVDANAESAPLIHWSQISDLPVPAHAVGDLATVDFQIGLKSLIAKLIRPPTPDAERRSLQRYLAERSHRFNIFLGFPLLKILFGVRAVRISDWKPLSPTSLAEELLKLGGIAKDENGRGPSILADGFGWADAIALRFAQIFRCAVVVNFTFASIAVIFAASSLLFEHHEKLYFVLFELFLIVVVWVNTVVGRQLAWHPRWFEAREVAERLRSALAQWTLGIRPNSFTGPEPAWTGWYVRAICREQSFRSGTLDEKGLSAARATLLGLLDAQCEYHRAAAFEMAKLERRLEHFGLALFGATALTALSVLLLIVLSSLSIVHVTETEPTWVTVLAVGLPALATATYGIRVIGDFEGIARRSERTHTALMRAIEAVNQDPLALDHLRARAQSAAEAMLGDVSGWRIAAEGRSLNIPG